MPLFLVQDPDVAARRLLVAMDGKTLVVRRQGEAAVRVWWHGDLAGATYRCGLYHVDLRFDESLPSAIEKDARARRAECRATQSRG